MKVDMHTHTLYSDGLLSPKELIDLAIEKNLSGIAITDHDTIEALEEANQYVKTKDNFILVTGIEFGCEYKGKEVHLLGYFIDYDHSDLIEITEKLKESRVARGEKIVDKLIKLEVDINIDDVKKFARDNYIGRPHIARALVEKNYVKDINEAFDKYLKKGAPAYVERFQLSIKESIELIKKTKGLSVLAHPGLIKDKEVIDYVISLGIDGIECYHSKHKDNEINDFIELAKTNNLIITGGSDFHGEENILGNHYIDFNHSPILNRRVFHV